MKEKNIEPKSRKYILAKDFHRNKMLYLMVLPVVAFYILKLPTSKMGFVP